MLLRYKVKQTAEKLEALPFLAFVCVLFLFVKAQLLVELLLGDNFSLVDFNIPEQQNFVGPLQKLFILRPFPRKLLKLLFGDLDVFRDELEIVLDQREQVELLCDDDEQEIVLV